MGKNLFVDGIGENTSAAELKELFGAIGEIKNLKIIRDKTTGRPKGYAFVEMVSDADAERALTEINGRKIGEKEIRVQEARGRKPKEDLRRKSRGQRRLGPRQPKRW